MLSRRHLFFIPAFLVGRGLARAESAGGISWDVPADWTAQRQRPMRAATYAIPHAPADKEDGECAVYYFGPGQGGGVEANIKRWVGQFRTADGKPADSLAKRSEWTSNGLKISQVDVTGTYLYKPAPMMPKAIEKPGYRMLAAIVEAPQAPVFFKLTGPAATVTSAAAEFRAMLNSVSK